MLIISCAFAPIHCCLVVTCLERADVLGLVYDVLLCFCHFPMWYPGSGVVLDCIPDLCHLPYSTIMTSIHLDQQIIN